jgi:haloalkane dehalogenase
MTDASEQREIGAADNHSRQRVPVLDTEMSYIDTGAGNPIVFLHGNPTYSYLWRNIIPFLRPHGRCLAPDLIGMGNSGKSPLGNYCFVDHVCYLDAWFDALELRSNVTLVLHDWGSVLGFHRAARFPEQVRAIAYMEAVTMPLLWDDFGEAAGVFRALRSERGEHMVLDENVFVEQILPRGIRRKLSEEEMNAYRVPFRHRSDRMPTLVWPRQIPVEGEPADVTAIVENFGSAMRKSPVPKLLIVGNPGALLKGRSLEFCRTWPNQSEVQVNGVHFLQEDSPSEIGSALQAFMQSVARSDGSAESD